MTRSPPTEQYSLLVTGSASWADERTRRGLARHFALVEWARDTAQAQHLLPRCHFDCLLVEADSSRDAALGWVELLRQNSAGAPVIVVAGPMRGGLDAAARRAGADECMALPLDVPALARLVSRRMAPPRAQPGRGLATVEMVGESEPIRAVRSLVARIAPTPATILLEGETGTGKELVARLVHGMSHRRGPFVPLNCGAIAPELMESELFGHAKGAFTGAHQLREGLFLAANGGTLFLDEVDAMRLDLQVKLLRALEEGAIRPVGSDREVPVDARIVASAQPGLRQRVADGRFREDLFYRLNVAHILLPPLRERPDDIAVLAEHFMQQAAAEFGMPDVGLGDRELRWLVARPWPGNVRELRNVMERSVLVGEVPGLDAPRAAEEPAAAGAYPLDWTLEQVKQDHMRRVVAAHGGNKSAAARDLGLSRKTLERKLGASGR